MAGEIEGQAFVLVFEQLDHSAPLRAVATPAVQEDQDWIAFARALAGDFRAFEFDREVLGAARGEAAREKEERDEEERANDAAKLHREDLFRDRQAGRRRR